jgi:hypothetical protein
MEKLNTSVLALAAVLLCALSAKLQASAALKALNEAKFQTSHAFVISGHDLRHPRPEAD